MSLLKRLLIALVATVGLAFCIALAMPAQYGAQASKEMDATALDIFDLLDTPSSWNQWSAWNDRKDTTLKYSFEGPTRGVGAKITWSSDTMGDGGRVVTDALPGELLGFDLFFGENWKPAHATIRIESQSATRTKVTWEMKGESEMIFFRLMLPMMNSWITQDLEESLTGLENYLKLGCQTQKVAGCP